MNQVPDHRLEGSTGCIAIQTYISPADSLQRASAVELIGYLLAYAEQTDARMLALLSREEQDIYKFVFCFRTPGDCLDFLRLLQLNDSIDPGKDGLLLPARGEISSARPISHVLPIDLVPKILAFADSLLGHRNVQSGL